MKQSTRLGKQGFTLTELLVVIAIIAVLSSISFTVFFRATAASHRVGCINVMHQVGVGLSGYMADNGRLPGPMSSNGQSPNYKNPNGPALFHQLMPYLGLEEQSSTTGLPDSLVCPAFRKRYPGWNSNGHGNQAGRMYRLNQDQRIRGKRIWGPQSVDDQETGTMSESVVANGTDENSAARIFVLTDGCSDEMTNPVHGKVRNFLFLDFHVESLALDFSVNPVP